MKRGRITIGLVNLFLILVLALAGPVTAAPRLQLAEPSIQLMPASGSPGTRIVVTGQDFGRATAGSVQFYWDSIASNPIGNVDDVSNGSFTAPATIPPNASPGVHTLIAFDSSSQTQAAATFTVSGSAKRALYIFDQDANGADFFKSLLMERAMLDTDPVPLNELTKLDLSVYDLILIGADTGRWESPESPEQVTHLLRSRKPIFAIGSGGSQLLGKMKLPIGSSNGMEASGFEMMIPDLSNPIFQTPYRFTGEVIPLYTDFGLVETVKLPDTVHRVLKLGDMGGDFQGFTPLIEQSARFYLWGYSEYPLFTEYAKQMLVNLLWQLLLYNAKVDTLILVDYDRMTDIGYTLADVNALKAKINTLVSLPATQSNMTATVHNLKTNGPATLHIARANWTDEGGVAAPGILSVATTNVYVSAIDQYIEQLKQNTYPELKYVIFVGAHEVIPMKARDTDDMGNPKESDWASGLPQTSGYVYSLYHDLGANNLGHYLTDSIYGDLSYINNGFGADNELVPELGVGRLVETPNQIGTLLDNYMGANAYLAYGGKASIASFDYMDGGQAAADILGASTDTSLILANFNSTLIPPVINGHNAFVYLAGHGNYNFIAPGFMAGANGAAGDTEELNMLPNSVVVTSGCHNGVNFGNMRYHDYTASDTYGEFPERMASRQVGIYLGATGFTWITGSGSSKNTGYVGVNEKLSVLFIKHLLKDGSSSTPGKAFQAAVTEYLGAAPDFANYTRRVLAIATLYGIPNYRPPSLMVSIKNLSKYGYSLAFKLVPPPGIASNALATASQQDITLQINDWSVAEDGLVQIPGADYTSGADAPVLPVISASQLFPPGSQVLDVAWDQAASESTTFTNDVPLFQASVNELKVPNNFSSDTFYPASPFVSSQTSTLGDGGVNLALNIWPVQYNQATHQTRIWTKLAFRVTYAVDPFSSDVDSDADTLPDYWEISYGLDPNDETGEHGPAGDLDGDGLTNGDEFLKGTNPADPDSDNDGVSDGQEVKSGTDPLNPGSANTYLFLPAVRR